MPTHVITPPASRQTSVADAIFDAVFERTLNFRIELPFDDALRFIERIEQYNDFESTSVIEALHRAERLIPRMHYSAGNPNNGRRDFKIFVGREGSPVMYIERFEYFTQTPMDEASMKAVCQEMQLFAKADEATYEIDSGPFDGCRRIAFRFWWD